MAYTFSDLITTEAQLRSLLGTPLARSVSKSIPALDEHCRAFISRSPFMLIASAAADGSMDISPKGDPAGFVQVLDDHTLAIPDRPGNRRADTFRNLLQSPQVGLLFLVPGHQESLRVNGTARLVRDAWLRERMAVQGKLPDLALVVTVQEAFIHCAKCIIRSKLWKPGDWPEQDDLPTIARVLIDHARLNADEAALQSSIEDAYREKLY
jgi:PPOX class probable FMN-dependent enzyme